MTEPPAANSAEPGAPHYRMVIDGHQIEAGSGHRYDTVDPFLGAAWATAADGDAGDVDPRLRNPLIPAATATLHR
jgi:uncharacterized protein (DUF736 family)